QDDKETTQNGEHRSAGRVGQLHFISAGHKFAAIPQTSPCFTGEHIGGKSNEKHYPSGNVIDFSEIHKGVDFEAWGPTQHKTRNTKDTKGTQRAQRKNNKYQPSCSSWFVLLMSFSAALLIQASQK